MSGRVVHFEIPFEDRDRVKRFYRDVFHWQVEEMPELDYVGVQTGPSGEDGMPGEPGYIGGGMTARGGANTATVIVLDSRDIDAGLARVESHGGEVLEPRPPVGDMGFAAYFTDCEGNLVGPGESA